jgi:hypothetical protein
MKHLNESAPAGTVQDDLRYNAAYLKKEIPFSITNATHFYMELEERCDALIQEQDELIRAVTMRCKTSIAPEPTERLLLAPTSTQQKDVSVSSGATRPISQSPLAPLVSSAFDTQATQEEIDDIEALEFEIIQLRQRMSLIEREITKYDPLTPKDAARKLQFLARLVADGGEVDMHSFAELADRCSEMLLVALGEVGFI